MGRTRSSSRYGYTRRAPYNLRSRTKVNYNYYDSVAAEDTTPKDAKPLPKVKSVDLCREANCIDHHTQLYEVDYPVFRRGQAFTLKVKLDRKLTAEEKCQLVFTTGRSPYPSKGTLLLFPLRDPVSKFGWKVESSSEDEQEFEVKVKPSAEAIIGLYNMAVQLSSPDSLKTHKLKETFCLLFNPWNPDDDVFMEDEEKREEYVMNPTGRIWVGTRHQNYGRPWIFGQFQASVLQTALYVLDISDLDDIILSNPVVLSRTFSRMANSFDDNGILAGNWSGDYSGGKEPTDWVGSVQILDEYMEEKQEVKYGQCWVFSGLITTLLRAVGIPSRSVTNFESAHDTDSSMTIDRHWNWDDKPLTDLNDSIWNFHVWNEAWMKRADLPSGHDGWQVIDGTPQERSEGVMQCGPASIAAIKQGDMYLPFDAKFVLAEVNGDIIEWVKEKSGEMNPVHVDASSVGFNISTKAVGSSKREDITAQYKYKEGSIEERDVMARVSQYSSRKKQLAEVYDRKDPKDVTFSLGGTGFDTGDIEIHLDMRSSSLKNLTVAVTLTCTGIYYNGATCDELKAASHQISLNAEGSASVTMNVEGKEYLNKIATDAEVAVFCKARVLETNQFFFKKETFFVDRPDVFLTCPSSVSINEEFAVQVSFTNKLTLPLTHCRLLMDSPGMRASKPIKLHKSVIDAGETIQQTFNLRAKVEGNMEIVALLHTRQLKNVTGSKIVKVVS